MTLQPSCSSQYFFCILVILCWHCFQVYNISFENAALFWFASSFQSFATMGCLCYSQCLSSHKSIIISNLACVNSLPSTWGLLGNEVPLTPHWHFTLTPRKNENLMLQKDSPWMNWQLLIHFQPPNKFIF
jgi:hypothetical protein